MQTIIAILVLYLLFLFYIYTKMADLVFKGEWKHYELASELARYIESELEKMEGDRAIPRKLVVEKAINTYFSCPEEERWLLTNKEARQSISQGLKDVREGRVSKAPDWLQKKLDELKKKMSANGELENE